MEHTQSLEPQRFALLPDPLLQPHAAESSDPKAAPIASPLASVPWGLVILSPEGLIEFANNRARSFMDERDGLTEKAGVMTIERIGMHRRLLALIAEVSEGGAVPEAVLGVPGHSGSTRYAIRLVPSENCEAFGSNRVLAAISDLNHGPSATRREISLIFGLSDREAEFAAHFASGMRVCDIASAMAIALNTARVHLRHVFIKTGTRGQLELARTFARLP